MNFKDWWNQTNAALKPIADWFKDIQNAPILVVGAVVLAVIVFFWRRAADAAKARRDGEREAKRDIEISEIKQLTVAQSAQIERALAAAAPLLAAAGGEGPQPAGADPAENLRTALRDFVSSEDPRGAEVATLVEQKRTEEAAQLSAAIAGDLEAAAARLGAQLNAKAAKAWSDSGAVAYLNDPRSALAAYEKARDLGADDVAAHIQLGILYGRLGRLGEAEACFKAAEPRLAPDDQASHAAILSNLGNVALTRGDLAAAEDFLTRALKLAEELGSKQGMAIQLGNLGIVALTRGDLAAAEDFHTRAMGLDEELGRKEGMAANLGNLGNLAAARGDFAAAEDFYRRAGAQRGIGQQGRHGEPTRQSRELGGDARGPRGGGGFLQARAGDPRGTGPQGRHGGRSRQSREFGADARGQAGRAGAVSTGAGALCRDGRGRARRRKDHSRQSGGAGRLRL